jgi:NADH-quinone oxidoreductase subunit L
MFDWVWLIPTLPLLGFVLLAFAPRLSKRAVSCIGVGSVGLATVLAKATAAAFIASPPPGGSHTQVLWRWLSVAGFTPNVSLYLDALSLAMVLVITVVGFLILLYCTGFMAGDDGYKRFFAYMDLFIGCMLVLVLARNMLLLYLGWEGVGLCSYLLIGFWHDDPQNDWAARKAFIVTRVGDAAMAVGLLLLFAHLGTLDIPDMTGRASAAWPSGSALANAAALLLLAGAVGKSAQLPLQVWLPDAMAGPTPVSALIHAATMVTAGVYLIARTHAIFQLAPAVLCLVACIGAVTLVLAGFSAAVQHDIKRVIAYSTISQIGYMFLALGVGAWSAGIYHFMTHACFKSLLFLGAGVAIQACGGEHSLFKMGGLRKTLPLTFVTFLVAALTLTAIPPTAGFVSKDLILSSAFTSSISSRWLYGLALAGAFLTGLYTFRMLLLAFAGPQANLAQSRPQRRPTWAMRVAMVGLAILCLLLAGLNWPAWLGGKSWLDGFLRGTLPGTAAAAADGTDAMLAGASVLAGLAGILAAWLMTMRAPHTTERLAASPLGGALHRYWFVGWGFDWLYDLLVVRPFVRLARLNKDDVLDKVVNILPRATTALYRPISATQNGRLRWYAAGIAIGTLIILAVMVWT